MLLIILHIKSKSGFTIYCPISFDSRSQLMQAVYDFLSSRSHANSMMIHILCRAYGTISTLISLIPYLSVSSYSFCKETEEWWAMGLTTEYEKNKKINQSKNYEDSIPNFRSTSSEVLDLHKSDWCFYFFTYLVFGFSIFNFNS
jgi:hypothetical protein